MIRSLKSAGLAVGLCIAAVPALAHEADAVDRRPLRLQLLSSEAAYVSGGDARIAVHAPPGLQGQLELWLNGRAIALPPAAGADRREGVVSGLLLGDNLLELRHRRSGLRDSLSLTNHPISGPMFTGPQQTPFVCTTIQGAVGRQPKVDSLVPPGNKVFDAGGQLIGYSRDCAIDPFVSYWYRRAGGGNLVALPADGSRPADMGSTTLADGRTVDFVVRREVGWINRFLYSMAMLAPLPGADTAAQDDTSRWNRKLLYWFQGGVAIGHSQGTVHGGSMNPDILGQGFAIVHSSGNNTGTHYNMLLSGETAMMTKERFIERYGVPSYTVGLGGSGGAIQQYMIAQNQPGVLDALLPVQSYPDMVTQTIHVGDCELLEHYMDVTDKANAKWRVTKQRSWLVGFNAEQDDLGNNAKVNDQLAALKTALGYSTAKGTSECVPAWRGLTPLTMNPLYGQAPNQANYEPQSDIAAIRWTHYDDLRTVYGVDASGAARITWDNVGVQYGLRSLKEGKLTPAEFLHLNWHIGGWKHPSQMQQETFPFMGTTQAEINKAMSIPGYFDPWSRKNMNLAPAAGQPAPRTVGDPIAQRAAYSSGHVFGGRLDVPAIDHRQYMERELDMHNSHQSFAVRKRVLDKMGHSGNLAVWFTDTTPGVAKASQTLQALAVMDQWVANIRANPHKSVAQNRPASAADACFNLQGQPIAQGSGVWDGILDQQPAGACAQAFPLYGTSRTVAGAPLQGGIYRCALKSVDRAVADGSYAPWVPSAADIATLKQIHPQGVCDYGKPDQAKPVVRPGDLGGSVRWR
ncbi:MAG: hypothetical protein KBC73_25490 [Burkholderiaceae bacterium]|nr:hypothetical protein [Burkholderiaceae bacterium]